MNKGSVGQRATPEGRLGPLLDSWLRGLRTMPLIWHCLQSSQQEAHWCWSRIASGVWRVICQWRVTDDDYDVEALHMRQTNNLEALCKSSKVDRWNCKKIMIYLVLLLIVLLTYIFCASAFAFEYPIRSGGVAPRQFYFNSYLEVPPYFLLTRFYYSGGNFSRPWWSNFAFSDNAILLFMLYCGILRL